MKAHQDELRLYTRLDLFSGRVRAAKRRIEAAFAANDSWFVAFSGGKDSTVVLSLVREYHPDTVAVSSVPKWQLPETAAYLARVPNLVMVASGSDHDTGWAANWADDQQIPEDFVWLGEKGHVARNYGRSETGVFLGLRQDESGRRRVHLRKQGYLFFNRKNGVWQCNPIHDWSAWDVWGYIYVNRVDYNRAYDRMDEIGIELERQRIGPLAVETALPYGQLAILKRGWPELFNEYVLEHPEASLYT